MPLGPCWWLASPSSSSSPLAGSPPAVASLQDAPSGTPQVLDGWPGIPCCWPTMDPCMSATQQGNEHRGDLHHLSVHDVLSPTCYGRLLGQFQQQDSEGA